MTAGTTSSRRSKRIGDGRRDGRHHLSKGRRREHRQTLDAAAGEVTRRKFEQELYDLKSLLAQAVRIKLEVVRAEREALERKLRNEASEDDLVPATARTVVGDEHLYWPYEGEYWRDELGTYELDFTMCRPLASGP